MRVITPLELSNTEGSYTRSSVASYVDSSGLLQTASANTVRVTYDPSTLTLQKTLLENSATNVLLQSEAFGTSPWITGSGVSVSTNAVTSPDGTVDAEVIQEPSGTVGRHWVSQVITITANTAYTFSVFVKAGTRNFAGIVFGKSGTPFNRAGLIINLTTGEKTADYLNSTVNFVNRHTPVKYPNGWWRVAVTVIIDDTSTDGVVEVWPSSNGTSSTYAGGSGTIAVWGAQLELGTAASSYISTTTVAVTRAADTFVGTSASLYYSTIPENDYAEWSSATNYSLGTKVIRKTTHKIYENLIAGTNTSLPENTVADVSPRWGEVGYTNRWSCLDLYRNTPTTATSILTFAVTPKQRFDSVSILGLEQAQYCSIVIYRQNYNEEVYSKLIDLRYRNTVGWYDYFFDPLVTAPGLVLFDLPPYTDAVLVVTLIGGTDLKCGGCVFGPSEYIGSIQTGAVNDVLNFSTVTRDVFGNAEMVRRRNVPKTNQTVYADKSLLNKIIALRDRLNAVPALWCGLDNSATDLYFDALLIFGFYRTFTINFDNPIGITINLELEEL